MNDVVARLLAAVRLGEPSVAQGLTIVPVFSTLAPGPSYITLSSALERGTVSIGEVDADGRVPELRATNHGRTGVLILDGEELQGAKQNRVLNTTVYLPPGSTVTIPVSCVEAGRWHADSVCFADSGYVADARVRTVARESVTANVRASGRFASDQHGVWREVEDVARAHGVVSHTCALRDVSEACREVVDPLVRRCAAHEGQSGLIVLHGGRVSGMDLVSRPECYALLHDRLVRSYAFEAVRTRRRAAEDDLGTAKRFVVSLAELAASTHRAPGSGVAHRFTGAAIAGDALTYRGAILHAAFFAVRPSAPQPSGRIADLSRRRSSRAE